MSSYFDLVFLLGSWPHGKGKGPVCTTRIVKKKKKEEGEEGKKTGAEESYANSQNLKKQNCYPYIMRLKANLLPWLLGGFKQSY